MRVEGSLARALCEFIFNCTGSEQLKAMGKKIHQVHNDGGRDIAHKYTMYETWMDASEPYPVE